MGPTEDHHEYCAGGFDPDDIVISGIAGRFPGCDNVAELKEALYSKRNLITFSDARFEKGMCRLPHSSCATINNLEKFDRNFFRVPSDVVNKMDPGARVHMEVVYEVMADAGVDAIDLPGMKIGLFNATTEEDTNRIVSRQTRVQNITSLRSMTPNMTSYALDFKGGSLAVDTACTASGTALWLGVCSLRLGEVDAAVVSGVEINLLPEIFAGFVDVGIGAPTGKSFPFDEKSEGMIRSESVSAIFLQKAKVARRAYANIQEINFFNAGYVPEGIVVPSGPMTVHSMTELLKNAKVDPDEIEYVEAHGTGTLVGDPIELQALDDIFCKNRKRPLLIGSIKSNFGHTEACSVLSGVIKSVFAFEYESIPPHINFETPNSRAPALCEGRLVIVTEPQPFTSQYIPVNSLGLGETHVTTLLKKSPIASREKRQVHDLPRLILFPATTEPAITKVFDFVQNTPDLTDDFFALLNKLSFGKPALKPFRGYGIFQEGNSPVTKIQGVSAEKRQVWYVMTGMGCQWAGMGLQLMKLDVFAESMRRSAETLKPYGIDLFEFLRTDKDYLQRDRCITPSFVGICSVQIALIDVLKHLGIKPDGIVGHSTGEILCAYADGCFTAEQALLSAYFRGQAVDTNTNLPEGRMAAVGASWSEAEKLCPKGIYPVCHNAEDSVTISGLKEPVEKLVEKLKVENIFVRLVNAHGYSFHCEYIHPVSSALRSYLVKLIPSPKLRTERWISTSYQESEWDLPESKSASADYFVHNLTNSVRFNEAMKKIPKDAIVIEIGPHALLRSVLKRAIGNRATFVGLMKRNAENSIQHLMESLGELYVEGVNPKIERLYPPVKFPVARGTPSISDLIEWDHTQSFYVPRYTPLSSEFSKEFKFDKDDAYILDHKIDGRSLFPGTGFIYLAWAALADKLKQNMEELPIFIENFKILRATVIVHHDSTTFKVKIMESTGYFQITEGKSLVASGHIVENKKVRLQDIPEYSNDASSVVIGSDIYDELRRCGYEYGPEFQSLVESNFEGTSGLVRWYGKWIVFLDALLAFFGLIGNDGQFALPTGIKTVVIDPNILKTFINQNTSTNNEQENVAYNIPVTFDKSTCTCRTVGIEISGLAMDPASYRGRESVPTLEEYRFVPCESNYTPTYKSDLQFSYYRTACNELMSKIGHALGKDVKQFLFQVDKPDDYSLEKVSDDESFNKSLVTLLKSASDNTDILKNKAKDTFCSYASSLGQDTLNNALVNEDSIRIMLEIISENTFKKINVVELYNDFPIILNHAAETMRKYSYTAFRKCIWVGPKTAITNQEQLDQNNIQVLTKENLKNLATERAQDVVIGSFMCGPKSQLQSVLQTLTSVLKPNGFILLFFKERTNSAEQFLSSVCGEELKVCSDSVLQDVLKGENLIVLSKISDPFGGSLYLLRTPAPVGPQTILHISENSYDWVEKVKRELYEKESGLVWLVSENSPVSGVIGLVNCLKQEPSGERIRCVFISRKKQENNVPAFSLENPFYKQLVTKNLMMNVWKDGCWGSFRHIQIKQTKVPRPVEHSFVQCLKFGDLNSFEWVEANVNYVQPRNRKLLHIYYSALNFKDVMLATGKLSIGTTSDLEDGNSILGLEFSGREDGTGKRFCGFSSGGGMATAILASPERCIEVPDNWTLEEAATVPVVYGTCYYALIMRGKLRKGESILIHSATGGIGLAAVNIALSLNCEVFATVGNDQKRKYLRKKYPQIKDENIGCSRDTSFKDMVLQRTNGKGVDVVLNSLADDKFKANFELLKSGGRFLEIGKYDLSLDRQLGLRIFLQNISFHAIFLDKLSPESPKDRETVKEIMNLIKDGIERGVVKPLDKTVFDKKSTEEAFRYMSKGIHVGKVLLKIRDEEATKCIIPKTLIQPAIPETQFHNNKVYIIIGGLGGFGMEVAKWIILKGGRNIILTSRYGARTPYHFFSLLRWRKRGVNAQVSTLNVGIRSDAEKLLKEAAKIGPVGGIFNSAVVLSDAFMDAQTQESYQDVCNPKAVATRILDELSRKLCPSLDYFVCFSSISCGRGNAGQTNYGYANSVMERVCEERRNSGLHGLAIQWGIIGEVGVVHRHMGESAVISGVIAQNVRSCLNTLDAFCQQDCPVVSTYVTAEQKRKSMQGDAIAQILKILGATDISQVNTSRTLGEMGMDSIVRVEVKQVLDFYTDANLSLQEMQDMRFDDIQALFDKADTEMGSTPAMLSTARITLPAVLVQKASLVELKKDGSGDPVFIVHIGDTDVMQLQTFSKIINKPLYALVWTKELSSIDVESLASSYLKIIADTTSGPFHVMGHSFGGRVAIEMALLSEKTHKKMKTITLIRSSDDLYKSLNPDNADETDPEVEAFCRFVQQFGAGDVSKLKSELQKASSIELREEVVMKYLVSSSSQVVDKAEVSRAISNYLQKYKLIESYIPSAKLSKDITLLEDPAEILPNDVSKVKEAFSQVCSGKISINRGFSNELLSSEDGLKRIAAALQNIV